MRRLTPNEANESLARDICEGAQKAGQKVTYQQALDRVREARRVSDNKASNGNK